MKKCWKCKEVKDLKGFHKNRSTKDGHCTMCKRCNTAHAVTWQNTETGRTKHAANASAWQIENKTEHAASVDRYQKTPKGKANLRANSAKYRAAKLQRTPHWLTKEHLKEIEDLYAMAKRLEELNLIPFDVDHIVPLKGKNVSGLHVPWNLRVIPMGDNRVKSNKFDLKNTIGNDQPTIALLHPVPAQN